MDVHLFENIFNLWKDTQFSFLNNGDFYSNYCVNTSSTDFGWIGPINKYLCIDVYNLITKTVEALNVIIY